MAIDISVKRRCVELARSGKTTREVYAEYFLPIHDAMSFPTFKRKLMEWKKKKFADETTLESGTFAGFIAHGATVQVDGEGKVTQAWIKQSAAEADLSELIEAIHEGILPIEIEVGEPAEQPMMLEVPLFDMHFPLSDHADTLTELVQVIRERRWSCINLIIGQDMLHNDDFMGRTSSGRPIEKVDMVHAWRLAMGFWQKVIIESLKNSDSVRVIYSKGNHDISMSWAFVQALKERFPQVEVDDSLKPRKCICWERCFIGLTHGNGTKSQNADMRGQFTIEYPVEFAQSTVREIHAGHLHHESEADIYGVMIRRLCRKGATDEWSADEGFVGAHKRFMVFEWKPGRLSAIRYL